MIDGGNIVQKEAKGEINISGMIDNGKLSYNIVSDEYGGGDSSSIVINGQEYIKNKGEINIVIYSKESGRVLDSASFNISSENTFVERY